jgi:cysteine desulfurase
MVYLDYSATTPVSEKVLEEDMKYHKLHFANANSIHSLGQDVLEDIENVTSIIKKTLKLNEYEIVYTSGATESNNLALKGIAHQYKNIGNHIITTPLEHGSITHVLGALSKEGFDVDVVDVDEFGQIDYDDLKSLLTDQTILVSVGLVNSETGIRQNLEKIREIIKPYPHVLLHSDMTQAIGKICLDYALADIISLSAHKIYGFKGIGALLYRKNIQFKPIIHGGHSLSPFRGGTPQSSLIHSLGVSLEEAYHSFDEKICMIEDVKEYLLDKLKGFDNLHMNSNQYSIPQIINISFEGFDSIKLQEYLSDHQIFVSTTSACSSRAGYSDVIKRITGDDDLAKSSIRISLSHLTTKDEIDLFIEALEVFNESH